MIILTISELKIFLREKPDIIISTGSEIAIPMIYLSKILGKKVIFIESLTRISDLSFTGKIVRIATDVFLVQWEELTKQYEDTLFKGNLLFKSKINKKNSVDDNPPFIFATVGTAPFPRLIKLIDELSDEFNGNIIVQIGNSQIKPKNAEFFDFLNYEDIVKLNENAKIVISHAGIGSILTALEAGTPLIVIPRKKRYEEINDDHQIQIANFLEKEGIAFVADNGEDLKKIIKNQNISPNEIQINQKRDIPIISFMRGILSQEAKRAEDS
jgi:UDP-N-acetylglucosamine transferase subunit ALG13